MHKNMCRSRKGVFHVQEVCVLLFIFHSAFNPPNGIWFSTNKYEFFCYWQQRQPPAGFFAVGCFDRKLFLSIYRKIDGVGRLQGLDYGELSFKLPAFLCHCGGNSIYSGAGSGNVAPACNDFLSCPFIFRAGSAEVSFTAPEENRRKLSDTVVSFGFFRNWFRDFVFDHRHCIQSFRNFSYLWNLPLSFHFTLQIKKIDEFCLKD